MCKARTFLITTFSGRYITKYYIEIKRKKPLILKWKRKAIVNLQRETFTIIVLRFVSYKRL